eukprot:2685920-Amphidinium_carterae.1
MQKNLAAQGAAGLAEGLSASSKTVTILYTSDTGHAEECAKVLHKVEAIGRQCRNGGYVSSAVRVGTMDHSSHGVQWCTNPVTRVMDSQSVWKLVEDSFDVHALPSEPLVIFCVATAGAALALCVCVVQSGAIIGGAGPSIVCVCVRACVRACECRQGRISRQRQELLGQAL